MTRGIQSGAGIAQNNFNAPLNEKHHVPLLLIVRPRAMISSRFGKHSPQPFRRVGAFRNARRMNVKTLRAAGEHPRCGPLNRPKTDLLQNTFIAADELAEDASIRLRVDCSGKISTPGIQAAFKAESFRSAARSSLASTPGSRNRSASMVDEYSRVRRSARASGVIPSHSFLSGLFIS